MGQAGEGVLDGGHQPFDHLALDPVGKVTGVGHVLEAAPRVADLLVLGERVGDEGEQTQSSWPNVFASASDAALRRSPSLSTGRQRRLDGQFLAVHIEAERRHGLVEQAVERATPGARPSP